MAVIYNKITQDIASQVANRQVSELLSFWETARHGDGLPKLSSFTRERLFLIWTRLMVLRRNGEDFTYEHYGSRIAEAAGFDMTGKNVSDFGGEVGDYFLKNYLECLETGKPIYATHHAEYAAAVKSWERLILPVVDDDGTPCIVCYNQPLDRTSMLFEALMEANMDGVALYRPKFDEDGNLVDMIFHMVNRHVCETFNMKEDEVIGRGLCELFPGAETDALPHYVELLETGVPCEFERRMEARGEVVHLLFKATKIQDRVMTVATNVTELRKAQEMSEQLLRQSRRDRGFLKQLIEVIPIPIFHRDGDGRIKLFNDAYARMLGIPAEDLAGKTPEAVYGPETAKQIGDRDRELLANPGATQTYERHVNTLNGTVGRDVVFHKASFRLDGDSKASIVGAAVDVTEENALRAKLERLASTDPMTGVANRRLFTTTLSAEARRSLRFDQRFSLIMLDIDHFKSVNDTYGHDMGDEVIRMVANIIRNEVRDKIDMVARLGGEEFAVILPETDSSGAFNVAERIRRKIETEAVCFKDKTVTVTASFGVACSDDDIAPETALDLLSLADEALYVSKQTGRNRTSLAEAPGSREFSAKLSA